MILSMQDEITPVFGLISSIIVLEVDDYYFVCEVLITQCFCSHYHAFEITHHKSPSFVFVKQTSLIDHAILSLYSKDQCHYIVLKYIVLQRKYK